MKLKRRASAVLALMCLVVLVAGFSCDKSAKSAAVAVNRYAESLSHFQDACMTAHGQGQIDDSTYRKILGAEKSAAIAGQHLDAAIAIASQGGDYSQYIAEANRSFADLMSAVNASNKQDLILIAQGISSVLQNAITLIQQIKAQIPAKPAGAGGLAFWLTMGGLPVLGMAVDANAVLRLLQLILALEPAAFDLVAKLTESLTGKTTEEVLAMNDTLFGKVVAEADQELAKLPPETPPAG